MWLIISVKFPLVPQCLYSLLSRNRWWHQCHKRYNIKISLFYCLNNKYKICASILDENAPVNHKNTLLSKWIKSRSSLYPMKSNIFSFLWVRKVHRSSLKVCCYNESDSDFVNMFSAAIIIDSSLWDPDHWQLSAFLHHCTWRKDCCWITNY